MRLLAVLKLAALAGLVVFLALFASSRPELLSADRMRETVAGAGPWAYLLYISLFALLAFAVPATLLDFAGALLFGVFPGTLLTLAGATAGAAAVYAAARGLGRGFVEEALGGRLGGLDRFVARNAFRGVLLVRFIPFFPYIAVNYGAGFLKVPFRPYLAATALGMFPATFVFTYFFSTFGERALAPGGIQIQELGRPEVAAPLALFFAFLAATEFLRRRLGSQTEGT